MRVGQLRRPHGQVVGFHALAFLLCDLFDRTTVAAPVKDQRSGRKSCHPAEFEE